MRLLNRNQSGFTLIEAVMVMVIIGILSALVASLAAPLTGYFASTARAGLSDAADTALRSIARELHKAVPNSVRITTNGSSSYIEFLPIIAGGRYRAVAAPSGTTQCGVSLAEDILDFTTTDTCFEVTGGLPPSAALPVSGNELVIYNTAPGYVYNGTNVAAIATGSTSSIIKFNSTQFPLASPSQRFQVIDKPVSFICDSATSTLWRYSGYTRQSAQPSNRSGTPLNTATSIARLATNVNCAQSSFVYTTGSTTRADLIVMRLTLFSSSNSLTLLHQVHVQNVP